LAPAYYSAESSNYETANIPVEVGRSTVLMLGLHSIIQCHAK